MRAKMRIVCGPDELLAAAPTSGPTAPEAAVIVGWGGGWGWSQRSDCSPGPWLRRDAPRPHAAVGGSAVPGVVGAGYEGVQGALGDGDPGLVHETEHVGEVGEAAQ